MSLAVYFLAIFFVTCETDVSCPKFEPRDCFPMKKFYSYVTQYYECVSDLNCKETGFKCCRTCLHLKKMCVKVSHEEIPTASWPSTVLHTDSSSSQTRDHSLTERKICPQVTFQSWREEDSSTKSKCYSDNNCKSGYLCCYSSYYMYKICVLPVDITTEYYDSTTITITDEEESTTSLSTATHSESVITIPEPTTENGSIANKEPSTSESPNNYSVTFVEAVDTFTTEKFKTTTNEMIEKEHTSGSGFEEEIIDFDGVSSNEDESSGGSGYNEDMGEIFVTSNPHQTTLSVGNSFQTTRMIESEDGSGDGEDVVYI